MKRCNGPVKHKIVFFGEPLPEETDDRFAEVEDADLLIVMGTSLQVEPFNSIIRMA
jgi:NAD-dependent SIR2 family protein deacetylase